MKPFVRAGDNNTTTSDNQNNSDDQKNISKSPGAAIGNSTWINGNNHHAEYYEPETLLEVSVTSPTKRGDHIEYLVSVDTNLPQLNPHTRIWKRYSSFLKLKENLVLETPQAQLPPFPPKAFLGSCDVNERSRALEKFLRGAMSHPLVNTRSAALSSFLSAE